MALKFYKEKVRQIENDEFDRHFEPQNDRIGFESKFPNVDIRHANNLTKSRWEKNDFRNEKFTEGWAESKIIPGWNEIIF